MGFMKTHGRGGPGTISIGMSCLETFLRIPSGVHSDMIGLFYTHGTQRWWSKCLSVIDNFFFSFIQPDQFAFSLDSLRRIDFRNG